MEASYTDTSSTGVNMNSTISTSQASASDVVFSRGKSGLVVLLHGFLDRSTTWRPLGEKLAADGWTVVAPDYAAGIAGADGNEGSTKLDALATNAVKSIDAHDPGHGPIVVVGHSMGGQVAELVARHYGSRITAMMLLTAAPLKGYPLEAASQAAFEGLAQQKDPEVVRRGRSARTANASSESLDVLTQSAIATTVADSLFELAAWTAGHTLGQSPSSVTAPVTVVTSDDKFFTPEFLKDNVASRFSNSTTHHVSGAGHWPHVEQPAAVAQILAPLLHRTDTLDHPLMKAEDALTAEQKTVISAEVEKWFYTDYFDAWIDVANDRAELPQMLQFWGVPMRVSTVLQNKWLLTEADVLEQLRATHKTLKSASYKTTIPLDRRVRVFNAGAACADAIWSRVDGDGKEVQRIASHFELQKGQNGWRVVALANTFTTESQLDHVFHGRSV
jgi:pimeloyl-ACP methyl ester carboxylesterase